MIFHHNMAQSGPHYVDILWIYVDHWRSLCGCWMLLVHLHWTGICRVSVVAWKLNVEQAWASWLSTSVDIKHETLKRSEKHSLSSLHVFTINISVHLYRLYMIKLHHFLNATPDRHSRSASGARAIQSTTQSKAGAVMSLLPSNPESKKCCPILQGICRRM